jgi:5-hydroxyisourate hydrolase
MNSSITTHVLGQGSTDADGRSLDLVASGHVSEGKYRLRFDTCAYFAGRQIQTFYPMVEIIFHVRDATVHHHVPLLLSPYGYTTYRGS